MILSGRPNKHRLKRRKINESFSWKTIAGQRSEGTSENGRDRLRGRHSRGRETFAFHDRTGVAHRCDDYFTRRRCATYHDERVDRVRPVAGCFAFVSIGETRRWKISFDPVTGAAIAKSLSMRFKRTLHSVEVSNRRVRRSCDSRERTASRYAEISNEIRTRSVYAFSRNKTVLRLESADPRGVLANDVVSPRFRKAG